MKEPKQIKEGETITKSVSVKKRELKSLDAKKKGKKSKISVSKYWGFYFHSLHRQYCNEGRHKK